MEMGRAEMAACGCSVAAARTSTARKEAMTTHPEQVGFSVPTTRCRPCYSPSRGGWKLLVVKKNEVRLVVVRRLGLSSTSIFVRAGLGRLERASRTRVEA
eukprot:1049746-Prymnesium_polylepis.1